MNQNDFLNIDWSKLPIPEAQENLDHLIGFKFQGLNLKATNDKIIDLSNLKGTTVIYIYPMTGVPGKALPEGWDEIPGARGCTPQSCSFRDNLPKLKDLGVSNVFGLSTQTSEYQKELVNRLNLPFAVLSDVDLIFAKKLNLPIFKVEDKDLIKRITLILKDNKIVKYFYPIFPPTRNIEDVISYLSK